MKERKKSAAIWTAGITILCYSSFFLSTGCFDFLKINTLGIPGFRLISRLHYRVPGHFCASRDESHMYLVPGCVYYNTSTTQRIGTSLLRAQRPQKQTGKLVKNLHSGSNGHEGALIPSHTYGTALLLLLGLVSGVRKTVGVQECTRYLMMSQ